MDLSQENIDPKKSLNSLYLIHGEEDLLRIEALDTLRLIAKQQGYYEREIINIDAQFNSSIMFSILDNQSLFCSLKWIEIHVPTGKLGKSGTDALLQLSKRELKDTIIVINFPKLEKAQFKTKWFISLSASATILEAKKINITHLPHWISKRLNHYGLTIEKQALELFADKIEGNLLAGKQEIDKLALLYPSGSQIKIEDIQNAITNLARFDVFQLSSAWMSGNKLRVQKLLEYLHFSEIEPILLLWVLSEDIRSLLRLEGALKQKVNVEKACSDARLWGDKRKLAPIALKRIGAKKLINALQQCATADRQIKGVHDGNAWQTVKTIIQTLTT